MTKNNYIIPMAALGVGLFLVSSGSKPESHAPKTSPSVPSSPTSFCKLYYNYALQCEYATGVPALVTLAQAGLESMWGKKAYGFNFFGIKAGSSWHGSIQKLKTWECSKTSDELIQSYLPHSPGSNDSCNSAGKTSYRVYARFRAYDSPADGFEDHGMFLRDNARYKKAFLYKNDPKQFAREIAKAGYATAPNYGTVLVDTITNVEKVLKLAPHYNAGKW